MRLLNVRTFQLEDFFGKPVPPYAILSHTWGNDCDEVSFRDVEKGRIEKAGTRPIKFVGCCKQATEDGLLYAWIDTCCIDKANAVELSEAINSMFQWYTNASICYAYLPDVLTKENHRDLGNFHSSRWFKRGWTLQELLAPKELRFYNSTWSFLGTRSELSAAVQKITGIPRPFLLGWASPQEASVAQRISWAAERVTKRKEDAAYCLLGIFGVMMPMIYGEGDRAFIRLQEEIMKHTRDDSILAWGFDPAESISSGFKDVIQGHVLAPAASMFKNCGQIVSREQSLNPPELSGGRLRVHLSLHTTTTGEIYGLLNCGPNDNAEQVMGIPLINPSSNSLPNEFIRPQGCNPVLLPKPSSDVSSKLIYIRREQHKSTHTMDRQHWFYIEESLDSDLELVDVEPQNRWQKDRSMITTSVNNKGGPIQRTLARFRTKRKDSQDFVVLLDFEEQGSQVQARSHLMICSRDTSLAILNDKLGYMRREVFGKQSASNGIHSVCVTVRQESVAGQPMFVVRLALIPGLSEVTIDTTAELRVLELTTQLEGILQEENGVCLEAKQLRRQKNEMADPDPIRARLARVEGSLRELEGERRQLVGELAERALKLKQIASRDDEIKQRQERLLEQRLETLWCLGDLNTIDVDETVTLKADDCLLLFWATENGYEAVVRLLLERGVDIEAKNRDDQTPLSLAAVAGKESVARLLLEKGADIGARSEKFQTPLSIAAFEGHDAVIQLLLSKGADIEAKDNWNRTPLSLAAAAGQESVVQLLLEKGADIETRDKRGWAPLSIAAFEGYDAVVKLLLAKGVDIEAKDHWNRRPLSLAAAAGMVAVMHLLLANGADMEARDQWDWTPLGSAAEKGQADAVRLLIRKGANIEAKDHKDQTPLILAAEQGHDTTVHLLLEKGADIEARNHWDQTSLILAAGNGCDAVVQLLLKNGTDIEVRDQEGQTPLNFAAAAGQEFVVRLLLEKGADIQAKDKWDRSPLSRAVENGQHAIVQLLLSNGADIEARDRAKQTPLSKAAFEGHEDIVQLLLAKGADIEAGGDEGRKPLDLAVAEGHDAVARLLLAKGAKG
jgi:ankyrin repeat protein